MEKEFKSKIKSDLKLTEDVLELSTLKTNMIIEQLEENIKLREMPIEKHVKKYLRT